MSSFAVELAALSEGELPGLLGFLADWPSLPFRYVSVHGPSKDRVMADEELAALLGELPPFVDSIVLHSDAFGQPSAFGGLGSRAVIENMDARKQDGRSAGNSSRPIRFSPRRASASMSRMRGRLTRRWHSPTSSWTRSRRGSGMSTSARSPPPERTCR